MEDGMHVRPLYDRVLVKRVEEETKTAKGLFLPETAKEKPLMGVVLAAGQGRLTEDGEIRPLVVKEGDRVVFGRYSGTEIKVDGEDRLVLREDEIFGIVES
jgi:chaperonin GroES